MDRGRAEDGHTPGRRGRAERGHGWAGLSAAGVAQRRGSRDAFADVTAEGAAGEGEGDLTQEDWEEGHVANFTDEAARVGLVFDARATISVETFEVLFVVGR